jgi:hypothetical protein
MAMQALIQQSGIKLLQCSGKQTRISELSGKASCLFRWRRTSVRSSDLRARLTNDDWESVTNLLAAARRLTDCHHGVSGR